MRTATVETKDIRIKITAKKKIPKKIIDGVRVLIKKEVAVEEEFYDWEDVKKEIEKETPDIKHPRYLLRAMRESQGLSQKQLAEKAAITQGRVSDMETGRRGIGIEHAKKLGKALKINYRKLL